MRRNEIEGRLVIPFSKLHNRRSICWNRTRQDRGRNELAGMAVHGDAPRGEGGNELAGVMYYHWKTNSITAKVLEVIYLGLPTPQGRMIVGIGFRLPNKKL